MKKIQSRGTFPKFDLNFLGNMSGMSGLVFPCILGAIIGLIVLNYRHSLRCENAVEHDETEDFMNALERRLAAAEQMGASNDKLMERLKYLLTQRLASVDADSLASIYANAEVTAVQDALKLVRKRRVNAIIVEFD